MNSYRRGKQQRFNYNKDLLRKVYLHKIAKYIYHDNDCLVTKNCLPNGDISINVKCTCGLDDIINEEQVSAH